jgi:hypothetical protein
MTSWYAVLGGGALIALAIVFVFRWEIAAGTGGIYRIDRWTGRIVECNAPSQQRVDAASFGFGLPFRCADVTDDEVKQNKLNPENR